MNDSDSQTLNHEISFDLLIGWGFSSIIEDLFVTLSHSATVESATCEIFNQFRYRFDFRAPRDRFIVFFERRFIIFSDMFLSLANARHKTPTISAS